MQSVDFSVWYLYILHSKSNRETDFTNDLSLVQQKH